MGPALVIEVEAQLTLVGIAPHEDAAAIGHKSRVIMFLALGARNLGHFYVLVSKIVNPLWCAHKWRLIFFCYEIIPKLLECVIAPAVNLSLVGEKARIYQSTIDLMGVYRLEKFDGQRLRSNIHILKVLGLQSKLAFSTGHKFFIFANEK
jgi:hypothetical protein